LSEKGPDLKCLSPQNRDGYREINSHSFPPFVGSRPFIHQRISQIGLKTKITFLIILIVAGVLLLASYLDYHFAKKDQIDLSLNRNILIAKANRCLDPGSGDSRGPSSSPR